VRTLNVASASRLCPEGKPTQKQVGSVCACARMYISLLIRGMHMMPFPLSGRIMYFWTVNLLLYTCLSLEDTGRLPAGQHGAQQPRHIPARHRNNVRAPEPLAQQPVRDVHEARGVNGRCNNTVEIAAQANMLYPDQVRDVPYGRNNAANVIRGVRRCSANMLRAGG